jgi:hypothetical protein
MTNEAFSRGKIDAPLKAPYRFSANGHEIRFRVGANFQEATP